MPRRPRIDLAGFHHVINRGVNRSDIFHDQKDFETFLQIVCKACSAYRIIVHDYCLMRNHFHLLVETQLDNLSLFMKQVNSNYAIYFNQQTKRSGHLWQGRFYSRYITDETYYYTLIRYIEQNPIDAKLTTKVGEYPFTLAATLMHDVPLIPCAKESKLLKEWQEENVRELIGVRLQDEDKEVLERIGKQKTVSVKGETQPAYKHSLVEHFGDTDSLSERNQAIVKALADGYTQAQIAHHLGVSRGLVSKIVKRLTFNA